MNTLAVRYLHDKKHRLVGCVVYDFIKKRYGFSYCHKNDRKKLSKELSRTIAMNRAQHPQIDVSYFGDGEWIKSRVSRFPVVSHLVPRIAAAELTKMRDWIAGQR